MGKCGEGIVSFIIDGWLIFYAIIITHVKEMGLENLKKNSSWLVVEMFEYC